MKRACLALLLLAARAVTAGSPEQPTLDYEALLGRLAATHPEYRAVQAEADAARAAIDAAYALPDPELRIELMDIDDGDLRPDQVGTTKYTVEQRVPLWGKRALAREAASAAHAGRRARSGQTLAELRAALRESFAEYHAASAELELLEETSALLAQALASATERHAAGLGPQQDLLRARTEQSALLIEAEALRARVTRARIALNALSGEPLETPLPPPGPLPATDGFEPASERVLDGEDFVSPALEIAERELRQREAERELATRERYPDLTVGLTPVQRGNRFETWELMVGFTLPLHGGTHARERERRGLQLAAGERRRATLLALRTAAAGTRAEYVSAREAERIVGERLLPEARLTYRSALAAYGNAQLDFDAVVAAALRIRDARRQQIDAALRQQLAVAGFERLTGVQP